MVLIYRFESSYFRARNLLKKCILGTRDWDCTLRLITWTVCWFKGLFFWYRKCTFCWKGCVFPNNIFRGRLYLHYIVGFMSQAFYAFAPYFVCGWPLNEESEKLMLMNAFINVSFSFMWRAGKAINPPFSWNYLEDFIKKKKSPKT